MAGPLTVVTLNSWKCDGSYDARLTLMAAEFARLRPDLLLLQESFATADAGYDTAAALMASAPGYDMALQPARAKTRRFAGHELDSISGMAVLTTGRIVASEAIVLPADPIDGERIAQIATIELDGIRVLVANVHLTYLPKRDELRIAELETLVSRLPALDGFDLALMAGDFNCPPDSAPIRWFLNKSGLAVTDACVAAGAESTFPTHGFGPDGRPATKRIDYVFLLGRTPRYAVTEVAPAFDAADTAGCYPSDHVGVRAVLSPAS